MYAFAGMNAIRTNSLGFIFAALLVLGSPLAHAVTIASYDFNGLTGGEATLAAASMDENITAGSISRGASYGVYAAAFSTNGLGTRPGFDSSNTVFLSNYTLSTAVANDAYFEFTLTPDAGYSITIDSLTLGSRRASSGTGPNFFGVRTSLDGYTADIVTGVSTTGAGGNVSTVQTANFGSNLQNITSTVTVRMYGYARSASNSSYGIWVITNQNASDVNGAGTGNFIVSGSVNSVPEPTTYALVAAVMALGVVYWRKYRS